MLPAHFVAPRSQIQRRTEIGFRLLVARARAAVGAETQRELALVVGASLWQQELRHELLSVQSTAETGRVLSTATDATDHPRNAESHLIASEDDALHPLTPPRHNRAKDARASPETPDQEAHGC